MTKLDTLYRIMRDRSFGTDVAKLERRIENLEISGADDECDL